MSRQQLPLFAKDDTQDAYNDGLKTNEANDVIVDGWREVEQW